MSKTLRRNNVVELHRADMHEVSRGAEIILDLWEDQPGKYFCIATKKEGDDDSWQEKFFSKNEFDEVEQYIKDNLGRHVYFCPHGFARKSRLAKYAEPPNVLWADLDERDPRKIKIKPTIAIESSPGRYVGLWVVDGPVPDGLNHRLTDYVGADSGGWGLSKVLRMPGTINYKREYNRPQGKIMWSDGPDHVIEDLDKRLPKPRDAASSSVDRKASTLSVEALLDKHKGKLKYQFRKRLMSRPMEGEDRSEGLYLFGATLIENRVPAGDAFVILKASPWNKYRGRGDEDEQIWAIINKMVPPAKQREDVGEELSIDESEFEAELKSLDYLIDGLFLRGSIYSFTAHMGIGKTAIALLLAMSVALGRSIGDREVEKGRVLYFAGENPHDVRMRWGGMKNFYHFEKAGVRFIKRTLDIDGMYDRIESEMRKYGDVALVVVDTGPAYLNGREENSNNEMIDYAQVLRGLTELPGSPTVLVLYHPAKGSSAPLIPRGGYGFYGELDGNVYATGERPNATLNCDPHKFRGAPFAPIDFKMVGCPSRVKNKKGKLMPTVVAKFVPLDERATEGLARLAEQDKLLRAMRDQEGASMSELAVACNWKFESGSPDKSRVQRVIDSLAERDLVKKPKGNPKGQWALTSTGRKRADELAPKGDDQ